MPYGVGGGRVAASLGGGSDSEQDDLRRFVNWARDASLFSVPGVGGGIVAGRAITRGVADGPRAALAAAANPYGSALRGALWALGTPQQLLAEGIDFTADTISRRSQGATLGSRLARTVGSWNRPTLAERAFENDGRYPFLSRGVTEGQGLGDAIARVGVSLGLDLATDPLSYLGVGLVGKAATAPATAARAGRLANLRRSAATIQNVSHMRTGIHIGRQLAAEGRGDLAAEAIVKGVFKAFQKDPDAFKQIVGTPVLRWGNWAIPGTEAQALRVLKVVGGPKQTLVHALGTREASDIEGGIKAVGFGLKNKKLRQFAIQDILTPETITVNGVTMPNPERGMRTVAANEFIGRKNPIQVAATKSTAKAFDRDLTEYRDYGLFETEYLESTPAGRSRVRVRGLDGGAREVGQGFATVRSYLNQRLQMADPNVKLSDVIDLKDFKKFVQGGQLKVGQGVRAMTHGDEIARRTTNAYLETLREFKFDDTLLRFRLFGEEMVGEVTSDGLRAVARGGQRVTEGGFFGAMAARASSHGVALRDLAATWAPNTGAGDMSLRSDLTIGLKSVKGAKRLGSRPGMTVAKAFTGTRQSILPGLRDAFEDQVRTALTMQEVTKPIVRGGKVTSLEEMLGRGAMSAPGYKGTQPGKIVNTDGLVEAQANFEAGAALKEIIEKQIKDLKKQGEETTVEGAVLQEILGRATRFANSKPVFWKPRKGALTVPEQLWSKLGLPEPVVPSASSLPADKQWEAVRATMDEYEQVLQQTTAYRRAGGALNDPSYIGQLSRRVQLRRKLRAEVGAATGQVTRDFVDAFDELFKDHLSKQMQHKAVLDSLVKFDRRMIMDHVADLNVLRRQALEDIPNISKNLSSDFMKDWRAAAIDDADWLTRAFTVLAENYERYSMNGWMDADTFRYIGSLMVGENKVLAPLKYIHGITTYMRQALLLSPSFSVRNMVGIAFNNMAHGVRLSDYRITARMWDGGPAEWDDIYREFTQRLASADRAASWASQQRGVSHNPFDTDFMAFHGKLASHYDDFNPIKRVFAGQLGSSSDPTLIRRLTGGRVKDPDDVGGRLIGGILGRNTVDTETLGRGAAYRRFRENGMDPDSAWELVNDIHVDYSDVSQLDINLRAIIPFWMFTSRNLPNQLELLARGGSLSSRVEAWRDRQNNEEEDLPPWMANNFASMGEGYYLGLAGVSPFGDITGAAARGGVLAPFAYLAGEGINPIIKNTLALGTGISRGKEYDETNFLMDFFPQYRAINAMFPRLLPGPVTEEGQLPDIENAIVRILYGGQIRPYGR